MSDETTTKRVAFLSFDWDYEIMYQYYAGMESWVAARDDVQLVIFNAFGQYANYEHEEGALEVFSLCDLREYDGLIVQGNRSWPPAQRQGFVDDMRALGKPVVSINYELEGACYVGTDNYEAMYGLVDEVLSSGSCCRPAYVNGLATSEEAQARARACQDACARHGLDNLRAYQANWQTEEGVRAALKMIDAPDDLPDVVFCCNDDLALGVQTTFQQRGIRVPEDVRITGFDNRDISLKAVPRISTVDRDYPTIGRTAIETLVELVEGASHTHRTSPVRYVLSQSCGYDDDEPKELIAQNLFEVDNALRAFYRVLTHFQPAILSADSITEIVSECESYLPEVRCPDIYLTINENYLESDTARMVTSYGVTSLLMAHAGRELPLVYDYRHLYATFLTRRLLPPEAAHAGSLYMVYPLRHNATCIGTVVTEGVSPILQYGFLTLILTLLSASIESARKKEMLQAANSRLDDLYVHDQLTGLFNRFGLERFGRIAYEHLLRDFDAAQFIFVDIDNMKVINDQCGHEIGDQALQDTADIIHRATSGENAFAMRYGGDEFLLICRRNLIPRLQNELQMLRDNCVRPYELGLSMGACRVTTTDGLTLTEAIRRADSQMYEIKKSRKTSGELS